MFRIVANSLCVFDCSSLMRVNVLQHSGDETYLTLARKVFALMCYRIFGQYRRHARRHQKVIIKLHCLFAVLNVDGQVKHLKHIILCFIIAHRIRILDLEIIRDSITFDGTDIKHDVVVINV